ncbi:MAG: molybdopterin-binding protein [Desulfosarcinaceae bacterium]
MLKLESDQMHEDEAAEAMAAALCGQGVGWNEAPREGKVTLKATRDGLFKVDVQALLRFNLLGDVMCATRHSHTVVNSGDTLAGTRAIPLVVPRSVVQSAVDAARTATGGVLRVLPMMKARVGVIITGNEVYYGHIQDKFQPVIMKKIDQFKSEVLDVKFLPDDDALIAQTALDLVEGGADVIITTGGMSVDPDDRTRFALKKAGAGEMVYGSAVLPGAMFMVAYLKGIPILGIPACGMYADATIFDLIFPRVLAGEKITREDIAALGHGGLCLNCKTCRFPVCPFGKA